MTLQQDHPATTLGTRTLGDPATQEHEARRALDELRALTRVLFGVPAAHQAAPAAGAHRAPEPTAVEPAVEPAAAATAAAPPDAPPDEVVLVEALPLPPLDASPPVAQLDVPPLTVVPDPAPYAVAPAAPPLAAPLDVPPLDVPPLAVPSLAPVDPPRRQATPAPALLDEIAFLDE